MCGRYTLLLSWHELVAFYELIDLGFRPNLGPRYNIAPTQGVPVVKAGRELAIMRWGLIPYWAKDEKIGFRTFNAKAETLTEKPSFRRAFRDRRCLIPASGFFEWQAQDQGQDQDRRRAPKQPYYIQGRGGQPLAFAGLWESWRGPDGTLLESCTIVTTEANDTLRPIHHRMPVILDSADFGTWLEPSAGDVRALLRPCPNDWLEAYPVSTHVNKAAPDDEACIAPL